VNPASKKTTPMSIERPTVPSAAELKENFLRRSRNSIESMLETHNPYSETFTINPDGKFANMRPDGIPRYFDESKTLEDLYRHAHEIESQCPHLKFTFDQDPNGKWIKYSVSEIDLKK